MECDELEAPWWEGADPELKAEEIGMEDDELEAPWWDVQEREEMEGEGGTGDGRPDVGGSRERAGTGEKCRGDGELNPVATGDSKDTEDGVRQAARATRVSSSAAEAFLRLDWKPAEMPLGTLSQATPATGTRRALVWGKLGGGPQPGGLFGQGPWPRVPERHREEAEKVKIKVTKVTGSRLVNDDSKVNRLTVMTVTGPRLEADDRSAEDSKGAREQVAAAGPDPARAQRRQATNLEIAQEVLAEYGKDVDDQSVDDLPASFWRRLEQRAEEEAWENHLEWVRNKDAEREREREGAGARAAHRHRRGTGTGTGTGTGGTGTGAVGRASAL